MELLTLPHLYVRRAAGVVVNGVCVPSFLEIGMLRVVVLRHNERPMQCFRARGNAFFGMPQRNVCVLVGGVWKKKRMQKSHTKIAMFVMITHKGKKDVN